MNLKTKLQFIAVRSLCKITTFFCIILLSRQVYGQVAVNIDISEVNNPSQTLNVDIVDSEVIYLIIRVLDADYRDEGQLIINGSYTIRLWPQVDSGNDNISSEVIIEIPENRMNRFNQGANTFEFRFLPNSNMTSDGYLVESIQVFSLSDLDAKTYSSITPNIDAPISANRSLALEIYKRLAGINTSIDDPVLVQMEQKIDSNDFEGAAEIASSQPSFYNLVVRDFAARMSTREQSINEPLNDFTATFIGLTRDNLDARLLLTGDLFYKGADALPLPQDMAADLLRSNNHYNRLVEDNYDLSSVLVRSDNQYLRDTNGGVHLHPDAAGVITSRAFMAAHASAGTNRRLVEYTFKQFTCNEMEEWGEATSSDLRVGRDIDRFPGGEGSKYLTSCKSCHSHMDGFRGAFARYNFTDNFVVYGGIVQNTRGINRNGVANKMNQNNSTFSAGFTTRDDSWVNYARSPASVSRFGWRGYTQQGSGVKQMGTILANSQSFSKCMVKKVYRELCRRPVASFELNMVNTLATQFESSGYKLKKLFERIAVRPECIGAR